MVDFNILNPNLIFDFNLLVPGGLRYFAFILRTNPLVYLRLQEAAGLVADDFTANNNDGVYTPTGIAYQQPTPLTNDKRDYAIRLEGGFIEVPVSASLDQAFTAFGADLWVKFPVMPTTEATLIGRGDGPGFNHFQVSVVSDGRVKFWLNDTASNKIAYSTGPMYANTWYHVMVIWDGTETAVFLNGNMGTPVANAPTLSISGNPIQIGAYNNASRLDAFVDEVAVYADALTQDDADQRVPFHLFGNKSPIITGTTANGFSSGSVLNIYEGDTVNFEIFATDPDGDTLQYFFSTTGYVPEYGPQLGSTLAIQFSESGVYYPVAFATDGMANRAAPFARINVDPLPDLVAFNNAYTTGYQRPISTFVLANDSFPVGGGGSISAYTAPTYGSLVLVGSGETAYFTYTPFLTSSGVEDTFTYTITNGAGAFDSALVTILVAEKIPPAINNITFVVGPDTVSTLYPQQNDRADPSSQTITLLTVQTPTDQGGSVYLDTLNNRIEYTAPAGYLGLDTFIYEAEDEDGLSDSATVTINVKIIVFEAVIDNYSVPYETPATLNVLTNDKTPYAESLYISAVTQPGGGVVTIAGDNLSVLFTPTAGFIGLTSFTYTLSDGIRTDTGTVNVTVRNEPPRPGNIRISTTYDTPKVVDVLSYAFDYEGEAIELLSFAQPAHGVVTRNDNATPGDLTDDTLTYTPTAGYIGLDSFTYVLRDAAGQTSNGTVYMAVDFTMSLAVSPLLTPVTESVAFNVLVSASSGYDKSYTYFWDFDDGGTSTAKSGTRYFLGIGIFNVSCTVTDSYGVVKTLSVLVDVGANQRPIANDIYTEVGEGQLLQIDPRTNDTDPDGDRFAVVDTSNSALGGFVSINNDGSPSDIYDDYITYVHPVLATPFSDSFPYTIEDEYGLQASATVYVNVLANLPPVAGTVFRPTVFNTPVNVYVLTAVSDPEGDPLYVKSVSSATHGSASIIGAGPNNYVRFTPTGGYLGVATFDYTARDSFYNEDQSQVTVTIFGQYYPKVVFEDTPIAFWPLNEPSGTKAYDMMILQSNGTYVSTVTRLDQGPLAKDLENAANVDQGYIQLPLTSLSTSFTDQMTLELWVKNTATGSVNIISDYLTIVNDGTTFVYTLTTDVSTKSLVITGMEVGEWYHLVFTYDGTWIRAYVDNFIEASTTHTGNVILPIRYTVGQGMIGSVSMVALYNRKLLDTEITEHYTESLGPIVSYDVEVPSGITAGSDFTITVKARDLTGKTVKTDNTTEVTVSSDGEVVFDADGDTTYGV